VQAWFKKAANDLRSARVNLAASPPLIDQTLFQSQQVAEKALKGFLTFHDLRFMKTHDLAQLANLAITTDASLKIALEDVEILTPFAVVSRYPDLGDEEDSSVSDAEDALKLAERVLEELRCRIPNLQA
jgi:HEPN domain-containing protein